MMSEFSTTNTLLDGERELLVRVLSGDGDALRTLLSRYARPIFSFVLHLSDCTRDIAYGKTTDLIIECLSKRRPQDSEWLLIDCLRRAIEVARALPVRAAFEAQGHDRFLKESLERLTFEDKAFLLLRDQLGLPYAVIGRVHNVVDRDARVRVERARLSLREALEAILRNRQDAR